jgi:hypothetical protein
MVSIDILRRSDDTDRREPDWPGKEVFLAQLRADLVEHGVPVTDAWASQMSTNGDSFSWLVAAMGTGGAGTALALALHKFIDRHKHTKVIIHQDGHAVEVTGYSAKDVERILKAASHKEEPDTEPDQSQEPPQLSDQAD